MRDDEISVLGAEYLRRFFLEVVFPFSTLCNLLRLRPILLRDGGFQVGRILGTAILLRFRLIFLKDGLFQVGSIPRTENLLRLRSVSWGIGFSKSAGFSSDVGLFF